MLSYWSLGLDWAWRSLRWEWFVTAVLWSALKWAVCAIFKCIVGFERGVQKRRALITDDNIRMRVAHQGTR